MIVRIVFFFQAEDGIRDYKVTGVQTCALPISLELSFLTLAGDPRSAEQLLREHIENSSTAPDADLSEHLWLLARWFYSNPRQGEIFFRGNAWPYRKMMRACARLLAPPDAGSAGPRDRGPAEGGGEREKSS